MIIIKDYTTQSQQAALYYIRKVQRRRRVARRKALRRFVIIIGIVLWFAALIAFICTYTPPTQAAQITPSAMPDKPPELTELTFEIPDEAKQIESALIEQGYFRDDIPLSYEEQDYLHTAAEEFGIPYELALAVIRQETNFRNVIGDDGASTGYMQIQARWHKDRIDKLGVTNLMDPYSNFRVGCSFLGELLAKYDLEDALTYYNSGRPGPSKYAKSVIAYMEEYQS